MAETKTVDDVLARVYSDAAAGGRDAHAEVRFLRTAIGDEVEIVGWRFGKNVGTEEYFVAMVSRGKGKTIDEAWRDMTCPECSALLWSTDLGVKGHCTQCEQRGQ